MIGIGSHFVFVSQKILASVVSIYSKRFFFSNLFVLALCRSRWAVHQSIELIKSLVKEDLAKYMLAAAC